MLIREEVSQNILDDFSEIMISKELLSSTTEFI